MNSDVQILRDIQRRLVNIVRRGRVHSVDFSQTPPRVRVQYAPDVVSAWLPWIGGRASGASRCDWEPLSVDEQCLILSESGDLNNGVVLPALLDSSNVPPSVSADEHVTRYSDGTETRYNRQTHQLQITIKGDMSLHCDGNMTLTAGGDIELNASGNMKHLATRIDLNE
ncbi:phage baseplate assembly protein V [Celerinatantimonas sp. YJH-8]|uniref:phage baseplate assembly protein V n=1 Tax=Celerinatantimonas sp. YJH-8 TaxID=3228714 RepID=UPI0038C1E610